MDRLTAFDISIMAEILTASLPNSFGQALPRHSCGVIRWNSRPSMIVSWRASSSGSMSKNLIFLRFLGIIGEGSGPGARFPTVRGATPCIYKSTRTVSHSVSEERCQKKSCNLRARQHSCRSVEIVLSRALLSSRTRVSEARDHGSFLRAPCVLGPTL